MGCDIHLVVQKCVGGQWVTIPFPGNDLEAKHYDLFAVLAGVRNYCDIIPISTPRGLPADFKPTDDDLEGLHTCSYLSLQEILDYEHADDLARSGQSLREIMAPWLLAIQNLYGETDPKDCRIVFGFDS